MDDFHLAQRQSNFSILHAISARMAGPGGLYNLGNAIGLASGVGFAVYGAVGVGGAERLASAVFNHLAGSGGAIALSLAMILFFISGELYHRAYGARDPSTAWQELKRADALSGVAALLLAVSLVFFGDFWMAITSTVLLAGGKFGNAFLPPKRSRVRIRHSPFSRAKRALEIDVFRLAVVVSRVPAMLGLLVGAVAHLPEFELLREGPTIILLGCYGLWLRADLLLAKH